MSPYTIAGGVLSACVLIAALSAWWHERAKCVELTGKLTEALERRNKDRSALDQRNELDRIKDEFISTVSHELRTPLTSIRGALGLLSSGAAGQVDAKAQNLLRIANTNTDRLVRLINDILDLQRMDSGQAPLHLRTCSLPEVVTQATETMHAMAHAADVHIEVEPANEDTPLVFEGDPDRMQQVLCNLLSNAIKFSPAGSVIRLTSGVRGKDLLLRVEDRGRGVPAEKLESIFTRFGQVEPSDSRQKGGTGLGLAICRAIMQQHGGDLWAQRNDAGGGTAPGVTLTVRIPRLQGSTERTTDALPQGAVLVVDDDEGVREVVAVQLRRHGYAVLEAENGVAALELAARGGVEAILLDLYMPGMSGWETLERLRRNAKTAAIPVVVLSVLSPGTRTYATDEQSGEPAGWVQKPFDEHMLLRELDRVLHTGSGKGRILLVEDDEDLASVVVSSFDKGPPDSPEQRLQVQHVSTVAAAKRQCELEPPDLMILDLTLADGDGFTLVDWLRGETTLRTLPLVVFSGRDVTDAEMEQLRLGPTQFLTKARVQPSDVERLVLTLMRTMRPVAEGTKITAPSRASEPTAA